MTNKDFSLNIPYLITQFKECATVVNNDRETLKTPGIIGWKMRMQTIGILLLSTGHTINYDTGNVVHTRKSTQDQK